MYYVLIMRIKFILIFFSLFSIISCENIDNWELDFKSDITSISYGTSFGFCYGYCKQSINIEQTKVEYLASSWGDDRTFPDIEITRNISDETWRSLRNEIDFIIFRNLDEVIGCPDCADGGAEWIEIETATQKHNITFEYNNPPEEIRSYINTLSEILKSFQKDLPTDN